MSSPMKALVAVVVVVCLALPVMTIWRAKSARIDLTQDSLSVGGAGYKVNVPYLAIRSSEISIGESVDSNLTLRTNGIGWPGFGLGWFRNAAGRKVFAYVSSGELIYIPTSLDYDVVVSREYPDAFVRAVKDEVGKHSGEYRAPSG